MASKPRCYAAGIPVLVTSRNVLRVTLLQQEALKKLLEKLVVQYAERCEVEVLSYAILDNHLHLTVVQRIHGHDPRREVGVAAFVRDVLSVLAKKANAMYSSQGHAVERTYRSHNLETEEDVLQAFAYTHGQVEHHHLEVGPREYPYFSREMYRQGRPNGIVTALPVWYGKLGETVEERGERMERACAEIIAAAVVLEEAGIEQAWKRATLAYIQEHQMPFTVGDTPSTVPVPMVLDRGLHESERERRMGFEWPRYEFEARGAPRVGQVLRIVVHRA